MIEVKARGYSGRLACDWLRLWDKLAEPDGRRRSFIRGQWRRPSPFRIVYMPTFVYRCPNTGYRVQGFVAEEVPAGAETYEPVTCTLCQQVHFVNWATGTVLGEDKKPNSNRS